MDKETILVIDDNLQIASFLANELLPSLGYTTLVAHAGKQGIEILRKQRVSLILLDLQLPDMTGLDVLRQLVREGYSVPTILMTAHGSEQIVVESFHLGVQDYLIKPLDANKLNDAITRALTETRLRHEKSLLNQQLREQVSSQAVLAKIGQSVTSSLHLDEVLRRIVEAGVHLTRAEEGFIALLDENTNRLFLRAAKNIDQEKSKTLRLPVTDKLISQVFQTAKPVRTTTESVEDPLIKISTGFFVHSLLHVPIISKNGPIGVLTVVNHSTQKPFKEKDEALLVSLAGYAAIALENAALYEREQMELQEKENIATALQESEERYALAIRGSNDGLWDWNLVTDRIYFSPRWKAILGYQEDEIHEDPQEWFNRVHPEDIHKLQSEIQSHLENVTPRFENEHRLLHRDGTYLWVESRGSAILDGNRNAYRIAGSITDISDRKSAEQKLLHYAFYDKLTGLPNRTLFLDHLSLAIERSKRHQNYRFAVLFLDLDRFKDINDSQGHLIGDELLVSVGNLLQNRMRGTDTVARFGGDEFVILVDEIRSNDNALQIADWIHKALSMPFYLSQNEVYISASIGIVLSDIGYLRPEDVLRDADIAMYHAKAKGKACSEVFNPNMRIQIVERLELVNDLRKAIENQELTIHYQAIVSLETDKVSGFEALVRWDHPHRGQLAAKDFIHLAEDSGTIISVDRWVLRQACRQLRQWQMEQIGFLDLSMSVNISGKQLIQEDFLQFIKDTIEETGVNPKNLILELPESVIIENHDSVKKLFDQLKAFGICIEIDDFGIGYSSLGYLSNLPVKALKIDQSFIQRLSESNNEINIINAMIMLARQLKISVIAEGVETEYQFRHLKSLGCHFGQGFFMVKPLPENEARSWMVQFSQPRKPE